MDTSSVTLRVEDVLVLCSVKIGEERFLFPAITVRIHPDKTRDLHVLLDKKSASEMGDHSPVPTRYYDKVPAAQAADDGPFCVALASRGVVSSAATTLPAPAEETTALTPAPQLTIAQAASPAVPAPAPVPAPVPPASPAAIQAPAPIQASVPIQPSAPATRARTSAPAPAPASALAATSGGYTSTPFGMLPPGAMPGPMPGQVTNGPEIAPQVRPNPNAQIPPHETPTGPQPAQQFFGRSGSSRTMASSIGGRAFRTQEQEMRRVASGGPVDRETVLKNIGTPIAGKPGQHAPRVFFGTQGKDGKAQASEEITPPEWAAAQPTPQGRPRARGAAAAAVSGQPTAQADVIDDILTMAGPLPEEGSAIATVQPFAPPIQRGRFPGGAFDNPFVDDGTEVVPPPEEDEDLLALVETPARPAPGSNDASISSPMRPPAPMPGSMPGMDSGGESL